MIHHKNFYPRSPCGERPLTGLTCGGGRNISIHALLAESDETLVILPKQLDNFYPRSPCGERPNREAERSRQRAISIHALLAESDRTAVAENSGADISIHALLTESDPYR